MWPFKKKPRPVIEIASIPEWQRHIESTYGGRVSRSEDGLIFAGANGDSVAGESPEQLLKRLEKTPPPRRFSVVRSTLLRDWVLYDGFDGAQARRAFEHVVRQGPKGKTEFRMTVRGETVVRDRYEN